MVESACETRQQFKLMFPPMYVPEPWRLWQYWQYGMTIVPPGPLCIVTGS